MVKSTELTTEDLFVTLILLLLGCVTLCKFLFLSEPRLSSSAKWAGVIVTLSSVRCEIALGEHLAQCLVCNKDSITISDHPVLPLFHDDQNFATLETSHVMFPLLGTESKGSVPQRYDQGFRVRHFKCDTGQGTDPF